MAPEPGATLLCQRLPLAFASGAPLAATHTVSHPLLVRLGKTRLANPEPLPPLQRRVADAMIGSVFLAGIGLGTSDLFAGSVRSVLEHLGWFGTGVLGVSLCLAGLGQALNIQGMLDYEVRRQLQLAEQMAQARKKPHRELEPARIRIRIRLKSGLGAVCSLVFMAGGVLGMVGVFR